MDQLLTKQLAMKENMDPRGNKWGIGKVKGTSLYHVSVLEGNKNTKLPEKLAGKFTSPTIAQSFIENYLDKAWKESDEQAEKFARRREEKE